ncbi:GNAT family N-acetyltransferase [Palleronia sp. KMU-117]|uniref:GNAT family N-acetyltransferase n=1 Tax=Palleronia sp. KMU-117 TaxID=3434108 RepID=UPI003D715824
MTPRAADAGDAAAIAEIWNAIIRDTLVTFNPIEKSRTEVEALIAARIGAAGGTFVAEIGGRVAGFASYAQFRGGAGYARTMEHTILLAPEARGQGFGRGLMAAVMEDARAKGVHSLFAGVSGANPEGRAFHCALGFQEVAVLREVGWKWGRWHDLHLMQKRL